MNKALPFLALLTACAQLSQLENTTPGALKPNPPKLTVAEIALVHAPSADTIAKALCPQVAPQPVCMMMGSPNQADLAFVFSVAIDVANDNSIPLPLVEALAAFTAFPGASQKNLGSVCLSMCDDPNSCPQGKPDACSSGNEVRTSRDYATAAAGFLLNVATGQDKLDNLKIKTIAAHGTTRVIIKLALNPDMMVSLLSQLASDAIAQVKRGSTPTFSIPYSLEGTVWVNVQSFGKIAAGFGPTTGTWQIK